MSEWLWRGCRRCCCGKWARRRPRASRVVRAARAAWALLTWRLCGEARDGGGELDAQLGIRRMLRLADLLVDSLPGQHLGSCWGEAIFHPEGERDTPGVARGALPPRRGCAWATCTPGAGPRPGQAAARGSVSPPVRIERTGFMRSPGGARAGNESRCCCQGRSQDDGRAPTCKIPN